MGEETVIDRPGPAGKRRFRSALLAITLAACALLAAGWLLRGRQGPAPAGQPVTQAQAPVQEGSPASGAAPAPLAPAAPAAGPEDEPGEAAAGPREPELVNPDPNLSFAHRAGLHRAANPLRLTASVALAVDADSGTVLYARNEEAILPIASLTKLLSAMVLLDAKLPMDERIRITRDDVDTLRHSRSRLAVGTALTRRLALHLALMSSENRAAHALARTYPGGVAAFVEAMNGKARAIGMKGARLVDPTGLSNRNRASARDIAALLLAAEQYPLVRQDTKTKSMRVALHRRRLLYLNSNRLVRRNPWPIRLQKTGYILESGHCMALVTPVRARRVVLVLMDAGSVRTMGQDARRLRGWVAKHPAAPMEAAAGR